MTPELADAVSAFIRALKRCRLNYSIVWSADGTITGIEIPGQMRIELDPKGDIRALVEPGQPAAAGKPNLSSAI